VPPHGGHLELWTRHVSAEDYVTHRHPVHTYGILPEAAGDPSVRIMPAVGDLIIFRATRLHAVEKSVGSNRIAQSCFLGYYGDDKPITMWS
jgi:hypothetical protein